MQAFQISFLFKLSDFQETKCECGKYPDEETLISWQQARKLQATLVWVQNYDQLTDWLTDRGEV